MTTAMDKWPAAARLWRSRRQPTYPQLLHHSAGHDRFTCLKAFAFDQRNERKDAHDLVYCLQHAEGGPDAVVAEFRAAIEGKHRQIIESAFGILRRRFCDDEAAPGFRKDGPVAVARFELGEGNEPELRERRLFRQREASEIISRLTGKLATPDRTPA
jgi:hypothetical protein